MTASWKSFATVDPFEGMTGQDPAILQDLVGGFWADGETHRDVVDPMNGEAFIKAVSYTHLTLPTTLCMCRSRWSPYH